MPEYGEVLFTLTDMWVAALNVNTGVYGTPVQLDYGQMLEVTPEADNDEVMAYGMAVELLSVITRCAGKLSQGLIDFSAYTVTVGSTSTESGVTPNRIRYVQHQAGGRGLPYFGLIGKVFSTNGADAHIGFPKCMLDTIPSLKFEQNKFVLPETGIKMIVKDTTSRKVIYMEEHETETDITDDFNVFFA